MSFMLEYWKYRLFGLDVGYIIKYKKLLIKNYIYTPTIRFMPCNLQGVNWTIIIENGEQFSLSNSFEKDNYIVIKNLVPRGVYTV